MGSSLLLFFLGCNEAVTDRRHAPGHEDPRATTDLDHALPLESKSDFDLQGSDDGVSSQEEPLLENEENGTSVSEETRECPLGQMRFEESCVAKAKVRTTIERRDQQVIEAVRHAKDPAKAAHASHDLLEQQVVQAQAAEDDLDEIILRLQQERAQKKASQAPQETMGGL